MMKVINRIYFHYQDIQGWQEELLQIIFLVKLMLIVLELPKMILMN